MENQKTYAISAPGVVVKENRKTLHKPERLQGIENFNGLTEWNRDIRVLNDGHSACVAEYGSFYRYLGFRTMLLLTLRTVVNGGIINGQLSQSNLPSAGRVRHLTVQYDGMPTMTNKPEQREILRAFENRSKLLSMKTQMLSVVEGIRSKISRRSRIDHEHSLSGSNRFAWRDYGRCRRFFIRPPTGVYDILSMAARG